MQLVIGSFLLLFGLGLVHNVRALGNLAPGRHAFWWIFIRGPLAGRELFTERGWRHWKRARSLYCAAVVVLVLGFFAIGN
jgi:hypothetical protein